MAKAAKLLIEYAGGSLDDRVTDVYSVRPPGPIAMPAGLPSRTAGVSYPADRVVASAVRGRVSTCRGEDPLQVTPPTWRPDLTDPADLAEEVIRLDGYDKIPAELPVAPPGNGLTAAQRRRRSVGRTLAEAGYDEVLDYPFVGPAVLDALGLPDDDPRRQAIRLRNPISEEEPLLRTTLLPPLLAALRRNIGRGHRDLALFEIGLVFEPGAGGRARRRPWVSTVARPTRSSPPRTRSCRASRGMSPPSWPVRSTPPVGGAAGGRRTGRTRSRRPALVVAAAGYDRRGTRGGPGTVAPRPVRGDRGRRHRRRVRR